MRTSDPPDLSDLTAEGPPGARALGSGDVVGGRYRIASLLGAGGFGHVWRAADLLGGEDVALKTLYGLGGRCVERARREITALRLLRIPGVVRLLDDGIDGGLWYLAMELVPGRPFPGPLPCPTRWTDVGDLAVALLETLGRVHAAGIVHRDLKPGNVLVTDDLRPIVLDFGLARGMPVGETITRAGAVLGTPLWLPPEQILGRPAGPAADLYAIGLMLYQALSGRLPHEGGDIQELWAARLARDPTPLAQLANVPSHVSDLVDGLLARDPSDRPATAHDALGALDRRGTRRRHELPWLGPRSAVEALAAAALAGRSARLVGAEGSGRTRTLLLAAELLAASGRAVAWASPAQRPFASVEALLDRPPDLPLEPMAAWVVAALGALLRAGTVLLVDSPAGLDPWSRRALAEAGAHGPVLSCDEDASGEAVPIPPLREEDLRPLFRGPDRLLHLRGDAARALHERTDGLPARVREEVAAWVRAGLCRWEDGALVITRPALETLGTGAPVAPVWVARPATHSVSRAASGAFRVRGSHRDLLTWVAIAWPHATPERIAAASGEPLWRVQAELLELDELGMVATTARGACRTAGSVHTASAWTDEQRRVAHGRLADLLPPGTDERLRHLVAAGADHTLVEEALAIAEARRRQGALGQASRAASEGLAAARAHGDLDSEARLLDTLARIALAAGAPEDLGRALYELGRAPRSPALRPIEELLRAGVSVSRNVGETSLALVEALPPFEDDELEGARQELRVRAARGVGGAVEAHTVAEAAAWARRRGTPRSLTLAHGWEGLHSYREGRYDEAAERQIAATATDDPVLRLGATVGVAASLVETGRVAEAEAWAERAREQAAALRLPLSEGQAEWLKRTAAYRRGAELLPDEELVVAARAVGAPHLLALVSLTEAAVALRAALPALAAELAGDAARVWRASGRRWEPLLAEALEIACAGGDPEPLVPEAARCPIRGFGVQILGLLARARPNPGWTEMAETLATQVPRERWTWRLDVLSVEESLAAVHGYG